MNFFHAACGGLSGMDQNWKRTTWDKRSSINDSHQKEAWLLLWKGAALQLWPWSFPPSGQRKAFFSCTCPQTQSPTLHSHIHNCSNSFLNFHCPKKKKSKYYRVQHAPETGLTYSQQTPETEQPLSRGSQTPYSQSTHHGISRGTHLNVFTTSTKHMLTGWANSHETSSTSWRV